MKHYRILGMAPGPARNNLQAEVDKLAADRWEVTAIGGTAEEPLVVIEHEGEKPEAEMWAFHE